MCDDVQIPPKMLKNALAHLKCSKMLRCTYNAKKNAGIIYWAPPGSVSLASLTRQL